jgi:hypothetical protein
MAKRLFAELPDLLSELEEAGVTHVDVDPATGAVGRWDASAHELGITLAAVRRPRPTGRDGWDRALDAERHIPG